MNPDPLGEVLSSRSKLSIMNAVSTRPRTLGELSHVTGISVQGVLRYTNKLVELGLLEERKVSPRTPKARKVYAAKSMLIADYSTQDLFVVKSSLNAGSGSHGQERWADLESLAGEVIFQRRRIGEEARRLARVIDEHFASREAVTAALQSKALGDEERLILEVVLTEETIDDGARALSRYYGLNDRRSIDRALAKARRLVSK